MIHNCTICDDTWNVSKLTGHCEDCDVKLYDEMMASDYLTREPRS